METLDVKIIFMIMNWSKNNLYEQRFDGIS